MIQLRTQTRDYWEHEFALNENDIEQLYNHFIEVGKPQSSEELVRSVMHYRVRDERNGLLRQIRSSKVYEPRANFEIGDSVVFPVFDFATGTVSKMRDGHNPQEGQFKVITVKVNGRHREFASALQVDHQVNLPEGGLESLLDRISADELYGYYHTLIEDKVQTLLEEREEFVYLGGQWFVKQLLSDVNIGHLHLAEAVLEMIGGGPSTTEELMQHLDMDKGADNSTRQFSLNYALLNDDRFDEVAPKGQVSWFLQQHEPEAVRVTPERLVYTPKAYDAALLSPQLRLVESEIADEWSDLESADFIQTITFSLLYPHRVLGTLPLNATLRHMLPLGRSPRQMFTFTDAETKEKIPVWVIQEGRYVYGLKEWYEKYQLVIGAFVTITKTDEPNSFTIDYDRRRPQTEDVRLATVADGRLKFELQRRRVSCNYDDLMVVGTEYLNAIDAVWKRATDRQIPLIALIAVLLPELAALSPQNAIHSKTLYSVLNMIRRVPPGPLFAELVRHPAFVAVGDQYWRFDPKRWQR